MTGQGRAGGRTGKRQRVMVLGNCVAERLQSLLSRYPGFRESFTLSPAPPVHSLTAPEQWQALADAALGCDIVFTQPLFNFGPCNTAELRTALEQDQPKQLILFAAPNFSAYFPDAVSLTGKENLRFAPVLEWDSIIIFSCFCSGVPIFDVAGMYCDHPLFHPASADRQIAESLESHLRREQGLDVGTAGHVIRQYKHTKLFHSPRHPADALLGMMLRDMAASLGLDPGAPQPPVDGFGFTQWPVITRHHQRFAFAEQDYFILAGKRCSLEDVAMAYYAFYECHPHVVEANRERVAAVRL